MKLRNLVSVLCFLGSLFTIVAHLLYSRSVLNSTNVAIVKTDNAPTKFSTDHSKTEVQLYTTSLRQSAGVYTSAPLEHSTPATVFLYLVQTERCLPPYLQSNQVLGNGSLQFDVIVLSYKEVCTNVSLPHVQYILKTNTTWTTGRNLLFEAAMNSNRPYLYYIFLDDDIILLDTRRPTDENEANPWRRFERFLRSVEPAVAAVDLATTQHTVEQIFRLRRDKQCMSAREVDYVPCLWYDAIFNAFHHKAVRHILPYDPTFDRETWWASQMSVVVKSEALFRGQVVLHTEIYGENNQHRFYPKDRIQKHMYEHMVTGLEKQVSKEQAPCITVISEQWKTLGDDHGWTSSTLCLAPPPPYDTIAPGRYACT